MIKMRFIIGTGIAIIITIIISGAIIFELLEDEVEEEMPVTIEKELYEVIVDLPVPAKDSETSIEEALLRRRSVRDYTGEPLTLSEVSQLLWAAQGITAPAWGGRTAPSAGATYPLEVYLVVGDVKNLPVGVYRYEPEGHRLVRVLESDKRVELSRAALGQAWVREGAVSIVFSAVYERTTRRYGDRGIRYVHMEVGHAGQNVHLQAVSLNLGTVVVGAFHDEEVKRVLNLPDDEQPLYIMPVGRV
ncbi:MAG: SagB/ThcOx family dehydrogenase [Methanophagales archaeon]|nr:SagB/ThcOx family dehydrogenase [Methanophagales archaeon]